MITYLKNKVRVSPWPKIVPLVIYTLFLLVCVIGFHSLWGLAYYSVNQPFGGFLITWNKERQCLIVHPLNSSSWPGTQPGLLKPFDCLEQVGTFVHDPRYGAKERGEIVPIQRETFYKSPPKERHLDYLVK